MRVITAKYSGKCDECGKRLEAGTKIRWERGYTACADRTACLDRADFAAEEAAEARHFGSREQWLSDLEGDGGSYANAEIARGMARAEHIRDTGRFFGEQAAMAEELAWELRDPSY